MAKIISIIIIFSIALVIFILYFPKPLQKIEININDKKFILEVAKTIAQKSKGLGKRNSLCENCGMIFTYSNEGIYPFWMKDTIIPLDIIWLNSSNEIISIYTAKPESNTPLFKLKIYKNDKPANSIIELNAGEANKLGLKIGDKICIQ